MLRNLCFRRDVRYVHDEISDNYRFTNLQAAVGLAQLERLDEFVARKRAMGKYYTERLRDIDGLILPIEKRDYADYIYRVYCGIFGLFIEVDNKAIQKLLAEEGIGSRTFFWCMHEQPVYQKQGLFADETYLNAEYLARKGFYIPSGLALTREQMERVVVSVSKVIRGFDK